MFAELTDVKTIAVALAPLARHASTAFEHELHVGLARARRVVRRRTLESAARVLALRVDLAVLSELAQLEATCAIAK
jgi:hypothetical protein